MKIDTKDRKILYQLDLDARQSFSQIGKKVGLSKNTVAYRVNNLEEAGVITNYYSVIDCFKLGYSSLRFYLTLQYTRPEVKKEIIDYFVSDPYTYFIGSIEGRYDLVIIMWVKQFQKFHSFWQETLKRYRDYFQQQMFSSYIQLLHYPDSWLLKDAPPRGQKSFPGHRPGAGGRRGAVRHRDTEAHRAERPHAADRDRRQARGELVEGQISPQKNA